jgi:hypothetical protein
MTEIRQAGRPLAQRELERRHGGQRGTKAKDLQQLTRRTIGRDDAFTETVGKKRGFRSIVGREAGHDNATLCNDRTNAPILKNARKCLSR